MSTEPLDPPDDTPPPPPPEQDPPPRTLDPTLGPGQGG